MITTSASAEIIKHSLPDADVFHLFSKCFALFTSQKLIWNPRNLFRKSKPVSFDFNGMSPGYNVNRSATADVHI